MDPNATLIRIIEAAEEGDADELESASADLVAWLRSGGFAPRALRWTVGDLS